MPRNSAERQARRRARLQAAGSVRVEAWLGPDAAAVLGRLQRHSGLSRGDVIGHALADAEATLLAAMTPAQADRYHGRETGHASWISTLASYLGRAA